MHNMITQEINGKICPKSKSYQRKPSQKVIHYSKVKFKIYYNFYFLISTNPIDELTSENF